MRVRYVVASLICAGVVAWLLIGGLAANIVYLRPVSYAVAHRAQQGSHPFRMAGQVEPGTIVATKGGVKFSVTDGKASAEVNLEGSPPDLFKSCAPVVVEGRWEGATFLGDRLLIRHGAKYSSKGYTVPDVKDAKCPADS
jgi:cytochrome c-type biogenesis protein CcmE